MAGVKGRKTSSMQALAISSGEGTKGQKGRLLAHSEKKQVARVFYHGRSEDLKCGSNLRENMRGCRGREIRQLKYKGKRT